MSEWIIVYNEVAEEHENQWSNQQQQIKESTPQINRDHENSDYNINKLKNRIEKLETMYNKKNAENHELVAKKKTLKELLNKSTNALLQTKANLNEARIRIDNVSKEFNGFKTDVKANYISMDEHKQLMREQKEQIRILRAEIQSFRDEFLSNITMVNNANNA